MPTASPPTGGVPPDPLGGRAAPRIPPAKALYWCTAKPTGAVLFLDGADTASVFPDLDGLCSHLVWRYTKFDDGNRTRPEKVDSEGVLSGGSLTLTS